MIAFVSGATTFRRSAHVGHLIVPKAWNDPRALDLTQPWAMDNGAFSCFDGTAFYRMLEAYQPYHGSQGCQRCAWVAAPDVVGDAAATLRQWPYYAAGIRAMGYPVAFVLQDGIVSSRIPEADCWFVGGTTAFKESAQVRSLMGYAKARGIWTHWGRVNGKRRYELARKAGVDSIDGTGFSMYPDTNIPKLAEWETEITQQPELTL